MSLVIAKDSVIMKRKLVYYMNTKTYCPDKQILSDVKHPKAKLRQTGSMEIKQNQLNIAHVYDREV